MIAAVDLGGCESCGDDASVMLADGSTWCHPCNDSARSLGYDDDEADQ